MCFDVRLIRDWKTEVVGRCKNFVIPSLERSILPCRKKWFGFGVKSRPCKMHLCQTVSRCVHEVFSVRMAGEVDRVEPAFTATCNSIFDFSHDEDIRKATDDQR